MAWGVGVHLLIFPFQAYSDQILGGSFLFLVSNPSFQLIFEAVLLFAHLLALLKSLESSLER